MTEAEVLAALEHDKIARRRAVLTLLVQHGRQDLADDLQDKFRSIDLGVMAAQSAWASLSSAMQHVMLAMEGAASIVRLRATVYGLERGGVVVNDKLTTLRTAEAMEARGLLAWAGPEADPITRAVLTERGRFILAHRTELPDGG